MKKLLLLALSLAALTAQSRELPPWQQLEFEQQAFWVSARSKLSLTAVADSGSAPIWRLQVESSVANNMESLVVEFEANSGRAIYRNRFSQGKRDNSLCP